MSISSKAQATVIKKKVTPIIVYGSDPVIDLPPKDIIENFKKIIIYVQDWYNFFIGGKTFAFRDIAKIRLRFSTSDLKYLSEKSFPPSWRTNPNKYDLYNAVKEELIKNNFNKPGEIYLVFVYAGLNYGINIDPMAMNPFASYENISAYLPFGDYIIIPPHNPIEDCKFSPKNIPPVSKTFANMVYVIAHQLGHCFGLGHTCTDYKYFMYPCTQSFMSSMRPPFMIMFPQEADYLRSKREWIY